MECSLHVYTLLLLTVQHYELPQAVECSLQLRSLRGCDALLSRALGEAERATCGRSAAALLHLRAQLYQVMGQTGAGWWLDG